MVKKLVILQLKELQIRTLSVRLFFCNKMEIVLKELYRGLKHERIHVRHGESSKGMRTYVRAIELLTNSMAYQTIHCEKLCLCITSRMMIYSCEVQAST